MRFFRRSRDARASTDRRASLEESEAPTSDEQPVVPASRRPPPRSGAEPRAIPSSKERASARSYERLDDSDVFVASSAETSAKRAAREVTLFVHRWHNVEPGLLSWTFPSLRAALDAVQRMKNAIGWCVVSGSGWTDLDAARASGAVLVEQLS